MAERVNNLPPIKVLVVDDTVTYRSILSEVVKSLPNTELCGTASNGRIALDKLKLAPVDLVLMDVEMPVMGGIETLHVILREFPKTSVVLISGHTQASADTTIKALEAGALDFIKKPSHDSPQKNFQELTHRLEEVLHAWVNKAFRNNLPSAIPRYTPKPAPAPYKGTSPKDFNRVDVIVIGVSTGGPIALNEIIPKLPANIGVPILIVQHMPPVFTASLAASLDNKSSLKVKEATDREEILPNVVYIAPGGRHMGVEAKLSGPIIALSDIPPENNCRPAVDVLFRTAGEVYRKNILSVILTGMGQDGMAGVKALKYQGNSYCITQSKDSCVVYGMPRAVDDMGLSDKSVDLNDLASQIVALVKR